MTRCRWKAGVYQINRKRNYAIVFWVDSQDLVVLCVDCNYITMVSSCFSVLGIINFHFRSQCSQNSNTAGIRYAGKL